MVLLSTQDVDALYLDIHTDCHESRYRVQQYDRHRSLCLFQSNASSATSFHTASWPILNVRRGIPEWLYSVNDGHFDPKHPLLPGSKNPVLLKFFKIPPLDHLLSLAQVMYANFFDGSSPQSSLYALQFGGQLVSLSVII